MPLEKMSGTNRHHCADQRRQPAASMPWTGPPSPPGTVPAATEPWPHGSIHETAVGGADGSSFVVFPNDDQVRHSMPFSSGRPPHQLQMQP
jgi:hypothetical protein